MALDLPTLLAIAATCAPTVAPQTLLAVARVESGWDPLAIGVNGPGRRAVRPADRAAAVAQADALIAAGRSVDLGLAQINSRNLAWLGLSVEAAFDPCRNLAASARVLEDGYRRAAPPPGAEQAGLHTALSYYNTGSATRGLRNGYVAKVVAAGGRADHRAATPDPDPRPADDAPAWDVFARARQGAPALVFSSSQGAQP